MIFFQAALMCSKNPEIKWVKYFCYSGKHLNLSSAHLWIWGINLAIVFNSQSEPGVSTFSTYTIVCSAWRGCRDLVVVPDSDCITAPSGVHMVSLVGVLLHVSIHEREEIVT